MMVMCCVFLQFGRSALHLAVIHNSVDVIDMLLMEDPTLIKETDYVSGQIMYIAIQYFMHVTNRST